MLTRDSRTVKTATSDLGVALATPCTALLLLGRQRSGKVSHGGFMAAHQQVLCSQCDKPEESCTCEKYCTICKGQTNVCLGVDGLYYCPDCREACDIALANNR